jgi:hypothetical protein
VVALSLKWIGPAKTALYFDTDIPKSLRPISRRTLYPRRRCLCLECRCVYSRIGSDYRLDFVAKVKIDGQARPRGGRNSNNQGLRLGHPGGWGYLSGKLHIL